MNIRTKTIGRLPQNKSEWDPNYVNPDTGQRGYGQKFRVFRYGCELESKIENNTYDPFDWDGDQNFVLDVAHWELCSGNPKVWAAGNPKPASTGTTGDYPYNGMGRVVIPKNMQNIAEEGEPENIVNLLTQEVFEDGEGNPLTNTVFVIQYDFVLGEGITIPANCVLDFKGGSISNGTIEGSDTKMKYSSPCFNNVHLTGSFLTDGQIKDTDIFIDSVYDTNRIKSMMSIFTPENKVLFARNTYTDIDTITLTRNADIDFGGSTIKMKLEQSGLPVSFIYTESKALSDSSFLQFFKIHNATIIGNEEYEYDGSVEPETTHRGDRRRNIQLFKVDEVEIDNITFAHVEVGTQGAYTNGRGRYELSLIAIMYYNHAFVKDCTLHDCGGDNLIRIVPNETQDNMVVVKGCHSYRNFTGLLEVKDGRCEIYDNICSDFDSSAMNLFVYDSDIHDNTFINSMCSDCIDLSEDGAFKTYNVKVHDNKGFNINYFCSANGDMIEVYNNFVELKNFAFLVHIIPKEGSSTSDFVNGDYDSITKKRISVTNNQIFNGGGIVGAFGAGVNSIEAGVVQDFLLVENNYCEGFFTAEETYSNTIVLYNVRKAIVRSNRFTGMARNPRGRSSVAPIMVYNMFSESSTQFTNDVEIVDNQYRYVDDAEIAGVNARYFIMCMNNVENNNATFNISILDNSIIDNDNLPDLYVGLGASSVVSDGNIGLSESDGTRVYRKGQMKFDNTKPVWWNGTAWVDATGTPIV